MTWRRYNRPRRVRAKAMTVERCPCGKNNFRRYETAMRVLLHLDPDGHGGVYFCARGGGYHVTKHTRRENDQRRAAFLLEDR